MSSNSYNNQQSTASRPNEYPIHKISFHFAFSLEGDAVLILKLFHQKKNLVTIVKNLVGLENLII